MPEELLPAPPAIAAGTQNAIAPTPIPPDATEEQLIGLWLHGKSPNTIWAYRRDIAAFRAFIGKFHKGQVLHTTEAHPPLPSFPGDEYVLADDELRRD
jgi:hypothetical protein